MFGVGMAIVALALMALIWAKSRRKYNKSKHVGGGGVMEPETKNPNQS